VRLKTKEAKMEKYAGLHILKTLVSVLIAVALSGCSAEQTYYGLQQNAKNECA